MSQETLEVPNTLVNTLTAVLNTVIYRGTNLDFQKKINGIISTMTRSYQPFGSYPIDNRSVSLVKGVFRYTHSVIIQLHEASSACHLRYQLYLSDHLISDIFGSGNQPNLTINRESPDFISPYIIFSDFGFLQRPASEVNRNRY